MEPIIQIGKINKDTVCTQSDFTKCSKGDLAHLHMELERLSGIVQVIWERREE